MTAPHPEPSNEKSGRLDRFEDAATNAGASVHRTITSEATETIAELVREPAVGIELPFDEVQLPESVASEPSHEEVTASETGVTAASMGIAPYGGVVVSMTGDREGPASLHPSRQIAVVAGSDVHADLGSALETLEEQFLTDAGDAVIVTGPSTTGDMGELVTGVHGPAELYLVVIEDA